MEAFLIWIFKWSLIVFLVSLILIGITTGISGIIEKNTGEYSISDSPDTKKNTTPADTAYSMSNYEYVDEDELERAKESEERMAAPYVCPECFEPYDGIFCENCGHSNDIPGYEEVSEADQWIDGMMAMAMYNEMDKELEEERAERSLIMNDDFDEYNDDYY